MLARGGGGGRAGAARPQAACTCYLGYGFARLGVLIVLVVSHGERDVLRRAARAADRCRHRRSGAPLLIGADAPGPGPVGGPRRRRGAAAVAGPAQTLAQATDHAAGHQRGVPAAPAVLAGTTLVIAAIAPLVTTGSPLDPSADLFAVVGLLALGTVALALAGIDTGTAFGGWAPAGRSRSLALVEPTILLAVFALSIPVGLHQPGALVGHHDRTIPGRWSSPASLLAASRW